MSTIAIPARTVAITFIGTGPMRMHPHDGDVDHLHIRITSIGRGDQDLIPDAGLAPSIEAAVAGRIRAIAIGQIASWRP